MLRNQIEQFDNSGLHLTYLITGLNYGGAETQLVQLATRMGMLGWKINVISMLPPQAYVKELSQVGVSVDTLGMRRGVPDPRACFRLATLLRKSPPQVLHAHMYHANILARLTRLLVPFPVLICTAHNIYESPDNAATTREITSRERAYQLTDSLCDLTTQVSHAGLERYVHVKAVPASKIVHVPVGVDIDRFKPDAAVRKEMREAMGVADQFVWLAVGRLDLVKDYPNLLQAVAKLGDADACVLIAGQGPLRDVLETSVRALGLQSQVRFLGLRRDIPELMQAADGLVMSSFYEGLPMVLLEAAASGLPIVATAVGGNGEVVSDPKTGFLVPARNPSALADAMRRLMQLPRSARLAMGEAGRAHVKANYSFERVINQWEALYFKLINRNTESEH